MRERDDAWFDFARDFFGMARRGAAKRETVVCVVLREQGPVYLRATDPPATARAIGQAMLAACIGANGGRDATYSLGDTTFRLMAVDAVYVTKR